MKNFPWYRWQPRGIAQLERLPLAEKGLAWSVLDFLWEVDEFPAAKTQDEWCFVLGYPQIGEPSPVWEVAIAAIEGWIRQERLRCNEKSEKASASARMGHASERKRTQANASERLPIREEKSREENKKKEIPPLPPRKREGNPLAGIEFVDVAFRWHPARTSQTGKPIARGSRAASLKQLRRVISQHGLTVQDVEEIVKVYARHPNVKEGFVQAVEVFWGENGRWLDCWYQVQDERKAQS